MNTAAIAAAHRTLVLEGCDGAGKSTLATRLAREHGFTVIHCPRTPDAVNLLQRYQDLLARPGRLVLDRCFLSELAYGPLYRGGSRITWDEARTLAKIVTNRDGVFLHLTASAETIRARLLRRDSEAPPAGGDRSSPGGLPDGLHHAERVRSRHHVRRDCRGTSLDRMTNPKAPTDAACSQ